VPTDRTPARGHVGQRVAAIATEPWPNLVRRAQLPALGRSTFVRF
jgi:hypothetical protein